MSDHVSMRIALMDKQIVDAERLPFGRVDDLELELDADGGRPRVVALLVGAQALGERLGGNLGRLIAGPATRLRGPEAPAGPGRVAPAVVDRLEPFVQLGIPFERLDEVAGLERWLARHVVERVPGGGDARI